MKKTHSNRPAPVYLKKSEVSLPPHAWENLRKGMTICTPSGGITQVKKGATIRYQLSPL